MKSWRRDLVAFWEVALRVSGGREGGELPGAFALGMKLWAEGAS